MPFNFKIPTPLSQASGGEKRSADEAGSQTKKQKALPPLGDLVAMESPTKKPNARRLPAVAALNICVYKARCTHALARAFRSPLVCS